MPQNPYRQHAMITMNRSLSHMDNTALYKPATGIPTDSPDIILGGQLDAQGPLIRDIWQGLGLYRTSWSEQFQVLYDRMCTVIDGGINGTGPEYGVAVIEKGTEEDSDNWHIHIAFKGQWNYKTTPKKLHKRMDRYIGAGQHVDIACKHHGSGASWPFNEMVKYLIEPSKKKKGPPELCAHPVFFGLKEIDGTMQKVTRENIYDKVESKQPNYADIKRLKDEGAQLHEVLEAVGGTTNYLDYRKLLDYYDAVPRNMPKLWDSGNELYDHQKAVLAWVQQPYVEGENGLWLNWPSGAGKTSVLKWLLDNYEVYQPGMRPNGSYDNISMMHYNGEPIIIMDEMQPAIIETKLWDGERRKHVTDTKIVWKRGITELLKSMCNHMQFTFSFGGKYHKIQCKAKVICTSNYPLPQEVGVQRRFTESSTTSLEISALRKPVAAKRKLEVMEAGESSEDSEYDLVTDIGEELGDV